MADEHTWEKVPDLKNSYTVVHRLKVPGGWLYQTVLYEFYDGRGVTRGVSTVFVPDIG